MKLDKAVIDAINRPFMQTWNAIGYDVYEIPEVDNECAVEMVIDANRMMDYGGENGRAADTLISDLIKEHGYKKVLKFLCKHYKLM